MLLLTRKTRTAVPRRLGTLTQIDHAAETRPQDLGLDPKKVARIWTAMERLYRTGLHPAMTLVVRRHGRIVLKRAIGALRGNGPGERGPVVPLSPDAPLCLFSASKSVSALLIHKLVEDGRMRLEDLVVDYIPEFGAHGKRRVTIRQLLSHRAGVPAIPDVDPTPELLRDWDRAVRMLCEAEPFDEHFERQAYHALTAGYIVGELVRRVGGIDLHDALQQWVAEPLGCRYLTYGLPEAQRDDAPHHYCTGPHPVWPLSRYIKDIVGVPFDAAVAASNTEAFLASVVPAGNIYASADDASRVFQMLLDGGVYEGRRLFRPETVAEAIHPVGRMQWDGTLRFPLRFSAGFMLGEEPFGLYGPHCGQAFGHLGFISVLCWADPQRDISVALLNSGKSVAPSGLVRLWGVLEAISRACPPV
ncbi:MAG: serine hydrolase [Nevskiales bacterium]|nr:serine hydrolase [Nevskiales bacterium]